MKVSGIWRIVAILLVGFALGTYVTSKVFINNIPPSTEITIGKVKIKGKDNTIENVMTIDDVTTEEDNSETRQRFRLFRRNR